MDRATVEQALGHPTWRMGRKITVDCASMMNKGLEVIEARWLFDVPEDRIEVAVHPESTVHSMVEFEDGAILAQLGKPDMRGPIGYALGFPERLSYGGERLRFGGLALSFEPPDEEKFSCLRLARQALRTGGSLPVALNAANEVAVEAFLRKDMPFGGIPQVVERVLDQTEFESTESVEQVYEWDRLARERARRCIQYSM